MAGRVIASKGFKTLVIEARKEIGRPVQCAEAISDRCLEASGSGKGPHLLNRINECSIMSPSGDELRFNSRGWCLDRPVFEEMMVEMAKGSGAQVRTGCRVSDVRRTSVGFTVFADGEKIRSRTIVLACGPTSRLPERIGLTLNETFFRGLNVKIKKKDRSDKLIFIVDGSFKGGYGWYFPRGEEVNVGYCGGANVMDGFKRTLSRNRIKESEISSYQGGVIPVGGPLKPFHIPGAILVGDAGGFSHPVSKGGIHGGMISGREGALGIVDLLSDDEKGLEKAAMRMIGHPAFEETNLKRAALLGSLSNEQLDSITWIAGGRPVREVGRFRFLLKALSKPVLYPIISRSGMLLKKRVQWAMDSW